MKLLVSVRSGAEARLAIEAGVDLLDIKEPAAGPLGAAAPAVWSEVRRIAAGRVPLSAAWGELAEADASESHFDAMARHSAGFHYAKVGLAAFGGRADWLPRWRWFAEQLPPGVEPVAVAYADWGSAAAPSVDQVLRQAIAAGWRALLVDTFDKRQGGLFDHLSPSRVEALLTRAEAAGMLTVLAGSLDASALEQICSMRRQPACVAVRGAACRGGRQSPLAASRIAELRRIIGRATEAPAAAGSLTAKPVTANPGGPNGI